ncbi:hypothetical protein LTR03_004427 [Friedmanniomyces endolithicus]|nr:hypothetical protein LTR03_004427 [Friedmanniomyces endolithicus]
MVPAKKMVSKIRPPRRVSSYDRPQRRRRDFHTTWGILETAFREIHTKNASALSFEELYRNAYKIVLKKKGEELYNRVAHFEEQWLGTNVRSGIVKTLSAPLMLTDGAGRTLATTNERREAGEKFLKS